MFNNNEFKVIYDLIKINDLKEANKLLIKLRNSFFIHPDYLFLMSLLLSKSNKIYLSIDTLLLSLKVDNTIEIIKKHGYENSSKDLVEERYILLILLLKKKNLLDLVFMLEEAMKKNDPANFLVHLEEVMPGIRLKNKL